MSAEGAEAAAGEGVRLTEAERRSLHEGVCSRHRDTSPGVYVCRPCESAGDAAVERIVAARVQQAEAEAWDRGHRLTAPHSDRCEPTCPNPYHAALDG